MNCKLWMRISAAVMMLLSFGLPVYGATYSGGAGTTDNPWHIANASDWTTLSETPEDWDKHFSLVANIDFQGASLPPVGNDDTPFTGVFSGGGHVVNNAVINLPTSEYVGVFGPVCEGGILRDLGVANMSMTGAYGVGGLVGWNEGDVKFSALSGINFWLKSRNLYII